MRYGVAVNSVRRTFCFLNDSPALCESLTEETTLDEPHQAISLYRASHRATKMPNSTAYNTMSAPKHQRLQDIPRQGLHKNSSIDKKLHTIIRFQRKHSLGRHHYLEVVLSVLQSQKVEASSLLRSLGTQREAPWLIHVPSSLATTISHFHLRSRGRKQTYPLPNTLLYIVGTPVLGF